MSRDKVIFIGGSGGSSIPSSYLDTDPALAANSDVKVASQKAVKAYVDTADALKANAADPVLSGLITLGAGSVKLGATAMAALAIDTSKSWNTKSISADSTVTWSGTPATSPVIFGGRIKNTDSVSHTITWPTTFDLARQASAATVVTIPGGGRLEWSALYDGTDYELLGTSVRIADLSAGTPAAADLVSFSQSGVEKQAAISTLPCSLLASTAGVATLAAAGQINLNTTDKQIGVHNGTREVAVPLIQHNAWAFDPKAVCDGTVDRLFLMSCGISEPKGITVVAWKLSFEADPTTEIDLDLKRADAFIGVANSAVMDVLDTTTGASSESTAANINSGAVVATAKVLYLEFGTAYTEANHQCIFEMWWEVEED